MNWSSSGVTKIGQQKSQKVTSNHGRTPEAEEINFNGSIKDLLVSHDESIEDKIATVKTAQMVDKGRFETAFKTLMKR